ncbi:MAG: hypothetical protein FJ398_18270 [Verrucomicrobia bacterium]|nr:hypothetical protein [Verrucomicrobiota bacterium]
MNSRRDLAFLLVVTLLAVCRGVVMGSDSGAKALYQNDLEKCAVGSVSEEFLVLDGAFKVQEEGGNKFLELPGAPLDTFGVLFGPTEQDGIAVAARVFGTGKGRRYPAFGVGLNGVGGFKLQVSPGKKAVEILRGDALKQSIPYEWPSGQWVHLRLDLRKSKGGGWTVSGKVWGAGQREPAAPTISIEDKEEPLAGRASIWGMPYSGTPIRFDDLVVLSSAAE